MLILESRTTPDAAASETQLEDMKNSPEKWFVSAFKIVYKGIIGKVEVLLACLSLFWSAKQANRTF